MRAAMNKAKKPRIIVKPVEWAICAAGGEVGIMRRETWQTTYRVSLGTKGRNYVDRAITLDEAKQLIEKWLEQEAHDA